MNDSELKVFFALEVSNSKLIKVLVKLKAFKRTLIILISWLLYLFCLFLDAEFPPNFIVLRGFLERNIIVQANFELYISELLFQTV